MNLIGKVAVLLLLFNSHLFTQSDVPGSKDHPLITRYPNSTITYYDQADHAEYQLALGPLVPNPDKNVGGSFIIAEKKLLSGRVTRIQYALDGTVSALEVYRNYQQALQNAGFKILLDSKGDKPLTTGGTSWTLRAYSTLPNRFIGELSGSVDRNKRHYMIAKLARPEGDVYVSVMSNQRRDNAVRVQLDIIEVQPMKRGLVKANAEFMANEIERTGHIAIYDLYFDFNSAVLKPESEPTLKEIARMLSQKHDLILYVVGHTDMVGTLEYNLKLSKDRAFSVVTALVKKQGVAANRLQAHGVGPLAPVAANTTDMGRRKNRRVELVAQ